uniref:Tetratricopeptide repeat protein 5 OB fold domain-containing protein n=1 Tax=Ditylenchus dipsaci TaxID=166011 RepID=A0A915DDC8_9BILA
MISLKVLGIVPNDEEVPYSVIASDDLGSVVGITMYNFSKKFFLIIGDSLLVPKPLLLKIKDFQLSSGLQMNLQLIRISDPVGLVKNGRVLGKEYRAYTNISIQTKTD